MQEEVIINRTQQDDKQTLGQLTYYTYKCKTLELPWKNNDPRISCIPAGTYRCVKRKSPKYSDHFHVTGVDGRSYILIHHGNYYTNTKGCILVGHGHSDINNDGYYDVTSSRDTMADLNEILPNTFKLTIIDEY